MPSMKSNVLLAAQQRNEDIALKCDTYIGRKQLLNTYCVVNNSIVFDLSMCNYFLRKKWKFWGLNQLSPKYDAAAL